MKGIFILLGIYFSFTTCWSQSDSTQPGKPNVIHLNALAFGTIDSLTFNDNPFTILSLVSVELFDDWDPDKFESKFGKNGALIVVAREDNEQKTKFVTCFSKHWLATGSKKRGYELAIEEVGTSAEIKHVLILKE